MKNGSPSLLAGGLLILLFGVVLTGPAVAQTALTFSSATFYGGSGDQAGSAVAIQGSNIYISGFQQVGGLHGLLINETAPPTGPVWTTVLPDTNFNGLAATASTLYPVGQAEAAHFDRTGTCGASDFAGDHERKSMLARFTAAGTFLGCGSFNYFPYRGHELYNTALAVDESGSPFIYAAGQAEQTGFNASFPFIMTKYDASGSVVDQVTEPGITLGSSAGCCPGYSNVLGLVQYNGSIYLAGLSRLTGFGEDNVFRPVLMKYSPSPLARAWKARPTDIPDGLFRAVTAFGGNLYAVGNVNGFSGPGTDYLIEKYDENNNRIWSVTSGGSDEDVLKGVVAVGGRLFAVGYTRSSGAGGANAVVLEIDPMSGATLSTTLFGGSLDEFANGAATDGTDLYVVGESRSFASAEGNAIGQNDVMLLRYTLQIIVSIDIKPGSFPNSIKPRSKGKIPVAILTTGTFDATTVDSTTVLFGATGTEAAPVQSALEDVNGDGKLDLVLQFTTQATGIQCGNTSASLTGKTLSGQAIAGSDSIRTVCK